MATLNGNYDVEYEFETNRWYHVASALMKWMMIGMPM